VYGANDGIVTTLRRDLERGRCGIVAGSHSRAWLCEFGRRRILHGDK
jgi:hypothetical protein